MNSETMTTVEVLEAITRERRRLARAIDALGERALTRAVTQEGWTAKDVLAHLLHWEGQVAFGLGAKLEPPAYLREVSGRPSGEEWNAKAVRFYRVASMDDLLMRHNRIVDMIVERVDAMLDADLLRTDAVVWATGRPLWQFIGGDTFLHWPQHSDAIEGAGQGAS